MTTDVVAVPVTRRRAAIIVAFALGGVTVAAFGSRLPSIQSSLGVSKTVIGAALMGVTVGSLVGLGAAAWVHRRFGARFGIGAALTIVAVGLATIGIGAGAVRSLAATVAGLLVIGLGIGTLDVLINVEGAELERAVGRTLMPLLHACWSAGAIVGAALGALSAAAGVPVSWQFAGEALGLLAATTFVVGGVPRHRPHPRDAAPPVDAGRNRRGLRDRHGVWTSGRLLLIGIVMLGAELGEGSANSWLTLAARTEHHHSEAIAAAFFVLFAIGETFARLLGGPLVDRFGRVATVRVTSAAGVVGVALFILFDPWWLTGPGVVLWAVGVSMGFPLGMTAAAGSGPDSAARVSVVATIGYAANLAGPPVLGALADRVGLLRALWVVVALLAVAAVLAAAVRAPRDVPSGDGDDRQAMSDTGP